mgnify:FL=1
MKYLKDPDAIYRASFEMIAKEIDLSRFPNSLSNLVTRVVHSVALPEIADHIVWQGDVARATEDSLDSGKNIIVDSNMVAAGIMSDKLSEECKIHCFIKDKRVPDLAHSLQTTRSAAAVELWKPYLEGAIIIIGNAPTALFHLLDMLKDPECPRPSVIYGFPVGFIGATEAKEELCNSSYGIPFVSLKGRWGGSPIASAAINAMLLGEKQ